MIAFAHPITKPRPRQQFPVCCPVCGCLYIHLVEISITPPGAQPGRLIIDAGGMQLASEFPIVGRGVFLRLTLQCENGHLSYLDYSQHKGEFFADVASFESPLVNAPSPIFAD